VGERVLLVLRVVSDRVRRRVAEEPVLETSGVHRRAVDETTRDHEHRDDHLRRHCGERGD
jgi:hypothetical protein